MKTAVAILLAVLLTPAVPGAQDKWLGVDKAKHFAAGAGVSRTANKIATAVFIG